MYPDKAERDRRGHAWHVRKRRHRNRKARHSQASTEARFSLVFRGRGFSLTQRKLAAEVPSCLCFPLPAAPGSSSLAAPKGQCSARSPPGPQPSPGECGDNRGHPRCQQRGAWGSCCLPPLAPVGCSSGCSVFSLFAPFEPATPHALGSTAVSWARGTRGTLVLNAGSLLNCNTLIRTVKAFLNTDRGLPFKFVWKQQNSPNIILGH